MPGRRKRKSSKDKRKHSLVFTESPLSIQRNIPSPVFCANHPLTAKRVPIEDLHGVPWVSPQFRRNTELSPKGKRASKRQASSYKTRLRNKSARNASLYTKLLPESHVTLNLRKQNTVPLSENISPETKKTKRSSTTQGCGAIKCSSATQCNCDTNNINCENGTILKKLPKLTLEEFGNIVPQTASSSDEDNAVNLSDETLRKSRRIQEREQFLLKFIGLTTPVAPPGGKGTVLAYDTPESDYGLSMRERRKKYYKQKQ